MLAHTQGLNPADNFEFLADFHPMEKLVFLTDLAGLTELKLNFGSVEVGDTLMYKFEKNNIFDPKAVAVYNCKLKIGYIKKIHLNIFHKALKYKINLTIKAIEHNGFIKRIFVKINF